MMDIDNKYGTLNIQKELLKLIKMFDSFCSKNQIKYSLNDGTLLGAIRHNGFIPWDDDLDIIMDRKNYTKFINLDFSKEELYIKKSLWIDKVRILNNDNMHGNSREAYSPANDTSPFLDVLVFDIAPNGKFFRAIKKQIIGFLQGMIKKKPDYSRFPLKYKLLSFITYNTGRLFSLNFKIKLYNLVSSRFGSRSSKYGSCYNEPFCDIGILHKSDALDVIIRHQFEDTELPVTFHYHEYLTELYGDYMTPPKEEDRIPLHFKDEKMSN